MATGRLDEGRNGYDMRRFRGDQGETRGEAGGSTLRCPCAVLPLAYHGAGDPVFASVTLSLWLNKLNNLICYVSDENMI